MHVTTTLLIVMNHMKTQVLATVTYFVKDVFSDVSDNAKASFPLPGKPATMVTIIC